jgi:hypothetical protein
MAPQTSWPYLWTGHGPDQAVRQLRIREIPMRCFVQGGPLQRARLVDVQGLRHETDTAIVAYTATPRNGGDEMKMCKGGARQFGC